MKGKVDIALKHVTMGYSRGGERIDIFDRLDMLIPAGDFAAIMGPSGSGKTTLLNLLGGLDRPEQGAIVIGDTDISRLSERELTRWRTANVGFIFQFYNLMPILTALENVELPLVARGVPAKRRRENAARALEIVGLADRAGHRPAELSGGQQQRVAIARALVADTRIILADEPTGDLDRHSAEDVLELLRTLNQRMGKTIVMVTHDANAAAYARRVLHLDKGLFAEAKELAA